MATPVESRVSIRMISGSSSQLSVGSTPEATAKISTTIRFIARLNRPSKHDRDGDRQPRELDLAHEVLAVHHAAHGAAGRFGEEGEEDDRAEKLGPVVVRGGAFGAVDFEDQDEEDVQHSEQQQRAHHLPDVPERRAEELQFEFAARDVVGELPEARPVVGQRARTADRLPEGLRLQGHAHDGPRAGSASSRACSARETFVSTGISIMPPLAASPETTKESPPAKRSMTSMPSPRWVMVRMVW